MKYIISVMTVILIGTAALAADIGKKPVSPLPAMEFRGKKIFPIGVFDLARSQAKTRDRLTDLDPALYECGVNCAFFGTVGMPDDSNYPGYAHIVKALEQNRSDSRFAELALIVMLGGSTYCEPDTSPEPGKAKRRSKPLSDVRRAECEKFLAETFRTLSQYPNIIGYSYDEPENTFNNYYQRTRGGKGKDLDRGISEALIEYLGWIRPLAEKNHPGSLQMPIIAWWGTYANVAPLYDVLIADQYPRCEDKSEFASPLYEVSFDAARAVTAARVNGRTAIYMPPVFDKLPGNWTVATLAEQRYLCFAPITRGAMGLMGWRLNRCSQAHREQVVYPVLKEVSRLKDFFLGGWHDELVSSNHDTATADYLRKFSARSKLLTGEEDGEVVTVEDFVPDVSYCLRRHSDGRWLLLAVNNRREPLSVKFQLAIPDLPAAAEDALSGRKLKLDADGTLTDDFTPFGVRAYIFEGK